MKIRSAGPAALYIEVSTSSSVEVSLQLAALQAVIQQSGLQALREVIPGYRNLLIEHDPQVPQKRFLQQLASLTQRELPKPVATHHRVNVHYGLAADQEALMAQTGLSWETIVQRHQATCFTVAFIGFTPGFPYLLGLPAELELPRRSVPRKQVPAGAVAIAGQQAGIYPVASPGGWWVLGCTDSVLFDAQRTPASLFKAGDSVSFRSVKALSSPSQVAATSPEGASVALRVQRAYRGSASLQASPRWGQGHVGLAQAGVLDPLAGASVNQLLANPEDSVVLELMGQALELEVLIPVNLAVTGGGFLLSINGREVKRWAVHAAKKGDMIALTPQAKITGNTAYLAVGGGFAACDYAGSRSTDSRGRVGGYAGRNLQAGDELALAGALTGSVRQSVGQVRYPRRIQLRIHPGPQYQAEAFERLLSHAYHVDVIDRMGVRLEGEAVALPDHEVISEGSPWGAVQIPASGQPIILLNDRGRTGGYAKPAICDLRDLWQLAQAKPGTEVWFVSQKALP